jgi:flagellar hook-basal body complex protein FliE
MEISSIKSLTEASSNSNSLLSKVNSSNRNESFESLLQSAVSMVKDTNNLSNVAEQEEMNYALGYTDSTHDLQVAQQKANLSLQYTVAVRNKVLEAYKEIMNLQF